MKNNIVANELQIEAIKNYVSKRFACYGLANYKFQNKETSTLTYGNYISQQIDLNFLGIFKHSLIECEFGIEVWRRDENNQENYCTGHLRYKHFNGGSNGCEINFKFFVNIEGEITEKYT